MRYLVVIVSILFAFQSSAAELKCKNTVKKIPVSSKLFKSVDQVANDDADYGSDRYRKTGDIFGTYSIQQCQNSSKTFQGVAVHFKAEARYMKAKAKVFTCLSKQKRVKDPGSSWEPWENVETGCAPAKDQVTPVFDEGSSSSYTPDDAFNSDFYFQDQYYGTDFYGSGLYYEGSSSVSTPDSDSGSGYDGTAVFDESSSGDGWWSSGTGI